MTDVNRSDQGDARVLTVTSIIDVNYGANQSATEFKLRPIRVEYEKGKLTLAGTWLNLLKQLEQGRPKMSSEHSELMRELIRELK